VELGALGDPTKCGGRIGLSDPLDHDALALVAEEAEHVRFQRATIGVGR
jgi:hypothetical protein